MLHWTVAKVDTNGISQLMKTRQQMVDIGYTPDAGPAVMYFLTAHFSDKDVSEIQKLIPRKDLVEAWRDIEDHAKQLAKRLMGKEAATPSRTWQLLSSARPEMVLFLAVTAKQQSVEQKIKNYLTKWRQVQQKLPLPEMTELLITPQLPVSQARARCLHALAGWKAAFPYGDAEVSEAVRTTAAPAPACTQARTRRRQSRC